MEEAPSPFEHLKTETFHAKVPETFVGASGSKLMGKQSPSRSSLESKEPDRPDQTLARKVRDAAGAGAYNGSFDTVLLSQMQNNQHDIIDMKASIDSTAATTMDTHTMSGANSPLRAVSPVVDELISATPVKGSLKTTTRSNGSSSTPSVASGESAHDTPYASPQNKLNLRITSFPDNQWRDDTMSISSSNETPHKATNSVKGMSRTEGFQLAEHNSAYTGPNTFRRLSIRENLELYFRLFVFSAVSFSTLPVERHESDEAWLAILQQYPRIQLWPVDLSKREQAYKRQQKGQLMLDMGRYLDGSVVPTIVEEFRRVWCEKVVPCGKSALQRLTPCRDARFGFHGELLWSEAESSHMKPDAIVEPRNTICCLSDRAFYIVADHDSVTDKAREMKKTFPLPIPIEALFSAAIWPHAMACHPIDTLRRVTIGFSFQRLTLTFADEPLSSATLSSLSSTAPESTYFTYILLTANKMETVALVKELQDLTREAAETVFGSSNSTTGVGLPIDNDDPHVLDALSRAVQPDALGMVLHYQILQQRWKKGDRGMVRRICVVTDSKLFLLDEDYIGDGSDVLVNDNSTRKCRESRATIVGASVNRLVDTAFLAQVVEVQAASADPKAITIVIKASRIKKSHNWRLLCRDRQGAERLVEDIRKAISMAAS